MADLGHGKDIKFTKDIRLTLTNCRMYSCDDKGYFQFGASGDLIFYDVDNSSIRLNINATGSAFTGPTGAGSMSISDSAFMVSLPVDGTQITVSTVKTEFQSPDGLKKLNIDNSAVKVTGSTATDSKLEINAGQWSSTGDYSTLQFSDDNHYIKVEYGVGTTLYDLNNHYLADSNRNRVEITNAHSKLISPDGTSILTVTNTNIVAGTEGWAGRLEIAPYGDTHSGGAIVLKGGETATPSVYYPDLHIDDFWGYARFYMGNNNADTYVRFNNSGTGSYKMNMEIDGGIKVGTNGTSKTTSAGIEIDSTTEALLVSRMTTAQRDALTALNGMIIYNTSTNAFNFRENGSWVTK
jgi:hypothetical protein